MEVKVGVVAMLAREMYVFANNWKLNTKVVASALGKSGKLVLGS